MLEKWCQSLDKEGRYGPLLTDVSKAIECLSHDLLIAKSHAQGFDIPALTMLHNYLTNRRKRVKIDSTFSSWEQIFFGVYESSILGPLLFNIFFLYNLFIFKNDVDIASYAYDNTLHTVHKNPKKITKLLENSFADLLTWFKNNGMKANADKCYLPVNSKRETVC